MVNKSQLGDKSAKLVSVSPFVANGYVDEQPHLGLDLSAGHINEQLMVRY